VSKVESRDGQEKKPSIEIRVKKTPGRAKRRKLASGSSKEDSREGQEKTAPLEGQLKNTPQRVKRRRRH
jgi:hypothetical protein